METLSWCKTPVMVSSFLKTLIQIKTIRMKTNLLYTFIGCCMLIFTACSDNIEDASSKHIYTADESPYLKANADAVITSGIEFEVGHFATQTIKLTDYSDYFKKSMNMTVDEVINGLKSGKVVFYNINTTRNNWNKASMTKGTTGWYYNTAGGVCKESDSLQVMSMEIDTNAKTLKLTPNAKAKAGTVFSFNVGFAVNGPDYDNYVRFLFNVSVTDPSIILEEITIPSGDYSSYSLDFNNYSSTIKTCMGVSVAEFLANLDQGGDIAGSVHMSMVSTSGIWDTTSAYTANPPGYWMTDNGTVCNWGATGFTLYAEAYAKEHVLNVGRAPSLKSGSKYVISIGFIDKKDNTKFFRFIITATME